MIRIRLIAISLLVGALGSASARGVEGASMPKHATIETSMGTITVELYPDAAPKTVENFVTLAKRGFYNHLIFHRVIDGFMIQTGDPKGTGMGGPGYTIPDERSALLYDRPGRLGMARTMQPNSGGSQFFITQAPVPDLNGGYTIFGQVTAGQDVVDTIAKVPRDKNDRPLTPVAMTRVVLEE